MSDPTAPTRSRRRWFRFSLRSLLVFTVLIGLLMGWIVNERRQSAREREIANQLSEQGVHVRFLGRNTIVFDPDQGWWRRWTQRLLGERIGEVYWPESASTDLTPLAQLTSLKLLHVTNPHVRDLTPLSELKTLQLLRVLGSQVEDVRPIAGLENLTMLDASWTQIRDITPLTGLKNLRQLGIAHTRIDNFKPLAELTNLRSLGIHQNRLADISPLTELSNLTSLIIVETGLTKEQVETLQKTLPKCKITHDKFE